MLDLDEQALDPALVDQFVADVRAASPGLRESSRHEILRAKGVVEPRGERVTVAGLYALGLSPQQSLETVPVMAVQDEEGKSRSEREFFGPLPSLLDQVVDWVRQSSSLGSGDVWLNVVRELVANALVHRDLGPRARRSDVYLRLKGDQLRVITPGGLYGITSSQIAAEGKQSIANEVLYEICRYLQTPRGHQVVEGHGTGLFKVDQTMRRAGLPPVEYQDSAIWFDATVRWQ